MAEYKFGNYVFKTEEEYNTAKNEVALIKQIKEKYDLSNPKVLDAIAVKFKPKTAIGKDFINVIEKKRAEHQNADILSEIDSEIEESSKTEGAKKSEQPATTTQSRQNTIATPDDQFATWYYISKSNEKIGPITEKQAEKLILSGEIDISTKVWKTGWKEWLVVKQTKLKDYVQDLPQEISDKWIWALAVIPLFAGILLSRILPSEVSFIVNIVVICLNCLFCILDTKYLRSLGLEPNSWMWLGFFLVPVYIFLRISKTSKKYAPGIVWIILFALYIISVSISTPQRSYTSSPDITQNYPRDGFSTSENKETLSFQGNKPISNAIITDSAIEISGITFELPLSYNLNQLRSNTWALPVGDAFIDFFVIENNELNDIDKVMDAVKDTYKKSSEFQDYEEFTSETFQTSELKCRKDSFRATLQGYSTDMILYSYSTSEGLGAVILGEVTSATTEDRNICRKIIRDSGLDPSLEEYNTEDKL